MTLLGVPYLPQHEPGGCLVACAAMVPAYLEQPPPDHLFAHI
jgi:hypothetical protein